MKTPEQVKKEFKSQGKTFAAYARQKNVPVIEIYRVLNGQYKSNYGRAHEIAVDLGLKPAIANAA